jgi:hypothetical protein
MKQLYLVIIALFISMPVHATSYMKQRNQCQDIWNSTCRNKGVKCVKHEVQRCQRGQMLKLQRGEAMPSVCDKKCIKSCDLKAVEKARHNPGDMKRMINECMVEDAS